MQPKDRTTLSDAGDAHCPCGALLARLVPGGVELKCRRCRRMVVLPLDAPELQRWLPVPCGEGCAET